MLNEEFIRVANLCEIDHKIALSIVSNINVMIKESDGPIEDTMTGVVRVTSDRGYRPEEYMFAGYILNVLVGLALLQDLYNGETMQWDENLG